MEETDEGESGKKFERSRVGKLKKRSKKRRLRSTLK
jgi:hypothetical protein